MPVNTINNYIYGPSDQPVEQIALSTSTPTYLTYTATNSTWVSTNQAGDQTGYWGYDAYGSLSFGTPTSPFGYSGQYLDAVTGLVNDRARWYEPQSGTFTTRDPDFSMTDAAYSYAGVDPVDTSDPSGNSPVLYVNWAVPTITQVRYTAVPGGLGPFPYLKATATLTTTPEPAEYVGGTLQVQHQSVLGTWQSDRSVGTGGYNTSRVTITNYYHCRSFTWSWNYRAILTQVTVIWNGMAYDLPAPWNGQEKKFYC